MLGPSGTVILPISSKLNMYASIVACIVKPVKQFSVTSAEVILC